jgi:hypothetical protein
MKKNDCCLQRATMQYAARAATSGYAANFLRQSDERRLIESLGGNCECPYDLDSTGRLCGERSAFSRPGGRSGTQCFL